MTRRGIVVGIALVLFPFATITVAALECAGEVVVLRTFDAGGVRHDTRTWIAEEGGSAYIEAANPDRPFLARLRSHPRVEVERRNGSIERYRATIVSNPEGREHIRAGLRRRYGLADWWVGLLTDTSESIEVRLDRE
jgi:hypothetical protein